MNPNLATRCDTGAVLRSSHQSHLRGIVWSSVSSEVDLHPCVASLNEVFFRAVKNTFRGRAASVNATVCGRDRGREPLSLARIREVSSVRHSGGCTCAHPPNTRDSLHASATHANHGGGCARGHMHALGPLLLVNCDWHLDGGGVEGTHACCCGPMNPIFVTVRCASCLHTYMREVPQRMGGGHTCTSY
jgi:hypothetical protein